MTVYAHITTTRAMGNYGNISFNGNLTDVWFVTISQSLSNKTSDEVKEILGIEEYGIWITTPFDNLFWIVNYNLDGLVVEEVASANLDNVYSMFEVDMALQEKADINHTHTTNDITDLQTILTRRMGEMSDDINIFLEKLTQALLDN